ncbi:hypothetical protein M0R72_15945 [Candidatus Pacearchaeota archaeon]|jgi:hypothetical protein|nr:hypothetical protein [Candidatus Pacearchaeota archaeon]
MAFIENAIYNYILSQPGITSYVGQDIYSADAPTDSNMQTDYIRYQVITKENDPLYFGLTKCGEVMIQIDTFSKLQANCIAIGSLLVTALNRFSGAIDTGITVHFSTISGPVVARDTSNEQWYHGINEWQGDYEY